VTTESLAIPVYFYTVATPLVSALIVIRILEAAAATLRKNEY
jgi:TRAP-type C4-dicarboxylate transport system permease small subunit